MPKLGADDRACEVVVNGANSALQMLDIIARGALCSELCLSVDGNGRAQLIVQAGRPLEGSVSLENLPLLFSCLHAI